MNQKNEQEQKTAQLLRIVETANHCYGCWSYRHITANQHLVYSWLQDFKMAFVFENKAYRKGLQDYQRGIINWQELHQLSLKIFRDELAACENTQIDRFFHLSRSKAQKVTMKNGDKVPQKVKRLN